MHVHSTPPGLQVPIFSSLPALLWNDSLWAEGTQSFFLDIGGLHGLQLLLAKQSGPSEGN